MSVYLYLEKAHKVFEFINCSRKTGSNQIKEAFQHVSSKVVTVTFNVRTSNETLRVVVDWKNLEQRVDSLILVYLEELIYTNEQQLMEAFSNFSRPINDQTLKIPVINDMLSLLAHRLPRNQTEEGLVGMAVIDRIAKYPCTIIHAPSGSGKSRVSYEGLCRNYGMYFTATKELNGGSKDFQRALEYLSENISQVQWPERNKEAQSVVTILFRIRVLMFSLLSDKFKDQLTPFLWFLIQENSSNFFKDDGDILASCFDVIRHHLKSCSSLFKDVPYRSNSMQYIFGKKTTDRSFIVVFDECQLLLDTLFLYTKNIIFDQQANPPEKEEWRTAFTAIAGWKLDLVTSRVFCGTNVSYKELNSRLGSVFNKQNDINVVDISHIGDFQDFVKFKAYFRIYINANEINDEKLKELHETLRGRHRFTTKFIANFLKTRDIALSFSLQIADLERTIQDLVDLMNSKKTADHSYRALLFLSQILCTSIFTRTNYIHHQPFSAELESLKYLFDKSLVTVELKQNSISTFSFDEPLIKEVVYKVLKDQGFIERYLLDKFSSNFDSNSCRGFLFEPLVNHFLIRNDCQAFQKVLNCSPLIQLQSSAYNVGGSEEKSPHLDLVSFLENPDGRQYRPTTLDGPDLVHVINIKVNDQVHQEIVFTQIKFAKNVSSKAFIKLNPENMFYGSQAATKQAALIEVIKRKEYKKIHNVVISFHETNIHKSFLPFKSAHLPGVEFNRILWQGPDQMKILFGQEIYDAWIENLISLKKIPVNGPKKEKRKITCGGCGETGHNKRSRDCRKSKD